jgi:hypothetical protein
MGNVMREELNGDDSGVSKDGSDEIMKDQTLSSSSSSDACCICLEDFRVGERLCRSYCCPHVFHLDGCMLEWLMSHDECPVCRRDYLCVPKQSCHSVHRNGYVDPVSPSLLPPTAYEGPNHQITIHQDGGSRIERRRIYDRFAVTSLFGFDDIPPWLIVSGTV